MGLADLHVHTIYSYDGTASVEAVLRQAKQIGLDVIAITDHDEIKGSLKALELAKTYGIEVIPGIEITTAEGDLLALNITEKIAPQLPLVDTVLQVWKLGGFCIAPHPMASGFGMKSLSAASILKALQDHLVSNTLIGIEAYNATAIDRTSNHAAHLLADAIKITRVGNSDAHVLSAIGLGATEFPGTTAADLVSAIRSGKTKIRKQEEWSVFHILGSWAANYVGSTFTRWGWVAQ